jgi:uncharacterized phage protein (TIGR01671 family)
MTMREILFRGKRIDNGEWVCSGNLIHFNEGNECYIPVKNSNCTCTHDINDNIIEWNEVMFCKVIPDTVGQYTGLIDKNGKRIFEGDILSFPDTGEDGYEYKEGYDFTNVATVCWNNGRWELKDYGNHNSGVMDDMEVSCHYDFITTFRIGEVIGNIHDNPELIAEAQDVPQD